jgi:Bacteriocin-protection, YdeI or OmpD-Associated
VSYFRYAVTGPIERLVFESKTSPRQLTYKVLFASPELERELPFAAYPRLRIEGEIEDVPVQLAWQPSSGRGRYVMLSPAVIKALRVSPGDEITLRFNLAPQDAVDVPEELRALVDKTAKRKKLWNSLTPGRQRGLSYFVASAKTAPTRDKRAALVVEKLETNRLADLAPPTKRRREAR